MSPEREAALEIEAALLVYGRDVEDLAEKYSCPELLRWVERLRAGGMEVIAHRGEEDDV